MAEYEIIIESMTPCGGSKYAVRNIVEAEAESPEAYVEQHKRFPIRILEQQLLSGGLYPRRPDVPGRL